MRVRIVAAVALLLLAAGAIGVVVLARAGDGGAPPAASDFALGQRTKSEGCVTSGSLPDRACTPGAAFLGISREQVCTRGYARSVRDVPDDVKLQVYSEYGLPSRPSRAGQYEVDHLVSLELGGSNDIANLWPQAAEPRPSFREKDRYENFLHDQLCAGALSLQAAQRRIAENWLKNWEDAGRP